MRSATLSPQFTLPLPCNVDVAKPPRLVREARRALRPVLKAMQRGKLNAEGFKLTRCGNRVNAHSLVKAIGRVLEKCEGFKSYVGWSAEKDGVYVTATMAVKIGKRAELEALEYAKHPDKHDILAESHVVAPCVSVMERATPLEALKDAETGDWTPEYEAARDQLRVENARGYYDYSPLGKRLNAFTKDAHDGNVAVASNGRLVLIDYSFDADLDER